MWQKTVEPYLRDGKLIVLGVVQEQHPDRAKLYRQWRKLHWPLFVDSLNLLDIKVVPIPVAIDASGVVRHTSLWPGQLGKAFMEQTYPTVSVPPGYNVAAAPDAAALEEAAKRRNDAASWRALGDACFLLQQEARLRGGETNVPACDPVAAYRKAASLAPEDGRTHFRLGVALQARYESAARRPGDGQAAVAQWERALAIDPNQYIWRRRIQQYGPRLDKPYNFYFWIEEARQAIRGRGETPVPLSVEPTGSEVAPPVQGVTERGVAEGKAAPSPPILCPAGSERIQADAARFVRVETVTVPDRVRPGHRVRVRLTLRLDAKSRPYWNNESEPLKVCLDLPDPVTWIEGEPTVPNPDEAETREDRRIEFELAVSRDTPPGRVKIPARALYYVCENQGGKCRYLRQDWTIELHVDPHAPMLR